MNADEFGKLQLELTEYTLSVSTPDFVTMSVPNSAFYKIIEGSRKFSKFKALVDGVQTSLYKSLIERCMFPELTKEKKNKIEDEAKKLIQGILTGYKIDNGKDYFVFVLDVNKNLRILEQFRPIKEDDARFSLYEYHINNISETIERKLNSIQTQFDNRAYV